MVNRNQVQWGQQVTVAEPAPGAAAINRGFASVGEGVVQSPLDSAVMRGAEVPEVRDWTIYCDVETDDPGRIAAPFAVVSIRYGSGASVFQRFQRIPVVGCVLHVVATHLDVQIELRSSGLPAAGNVTLGAYVANGRPALQRIQVADFLATSPGVYQIPPYSTGGMFWEADNAGGSSLAGAWRYNALNRGALAPTTAPQWSQLQGVPQDANRVVVLPTRNNLNLFWEVYS